MAKLGISEFSYGFSFLHEQVNRNGNPRCIPVLPSLQKESELGWDAKLPTKGIDYYFQFKMSDYLKGGNANYIKDGTYQGSYYRIALHKANGNKQHNLLYALSQKNPYVYYVAPKITSDDDFYDACANSTVTGRSMMIPVSTCGYVSDSLQHFMTYPEFGYEWHFHSKPKRYDDAIEGENIVSHFEESVKDWVTIDDTFALNVYNRMMQSTQAFLNGVFERQEDDDRQYVCDDKIPCVAFESIRKVISNVEKLLHRGLNKSDAPTILQKASDIAMILYSSALMIVGKK